MAYTNDSLVKSVDWITVTLYLALIVLGWISICGASYDYSDVDFFSMETRAGKQLLWMGCSLVLGFVILMLEDKIYDWFAYLFYAAMMLLLLVTPFIAEDTKGSYSWIKFGSVSLQPAEFAKFTTALALAKFIQSYGFTMSRLKYSVPVVGMILLPMVLIVLQRRDGVCLGLSGLLLDAVPRGHAWFHLVYRDLCGGIFRCGYPFQSRSDARRMYACG